MLMADGWWIKVEATRKVEGTLIVAACPVRCWDNKRIIMHEDLFGSHR